MTVRSVATPTPDDLPQPMPDAYFAPALFQTLFWKPRFLVDSPVTAHLPLLFWLAAAIRPQRVAVLGCNDGAAHFALCQALDKLGLDARCQGYGFWPDPCPDAAHAALPPALATHEAMLYDSLSQIAPGVPMADALDRIGTDRPDILFVDHAALPPDTHLTAEALMACLSATGVLVLHGTHALQARNGDGRNLARFLRASPHVEFTAEQGLIVVPRSDQMPAPLQSLIDSSSQGVLRSDVERVFRRSGQGLLASARTDTQMLKLRQAEQALTATQAELETAQADLAELRAALGTGNQALADTRAQTEAALGECQRLSHELAAQTTATTAAWANAESARAEAAAAQDQIHAANAQTEVALRSVEAARQTHFRETAELTRLAEAAQTELDARTAQLTSDLEASRKAQQSERDARFAETTELTRKLEDLRQRKSTGLVPSAAPPNASQEAEALRVHAAELRRDMGILVKRLDAVTAERDQLRTEGHGLRAEIEALRTSTSWRVTAPMRRVKLGLSRRD